MFEGARSYLSASICAVTLLVFSQARLASADEALSVTEANRDRLVAVDYGRLRCLNNLLFRPDSSEAELGEDLKQIIPRTVKRRLKRKIAAANSDRKRRRLKNKLKRFKRALRECRNMPPPGNSDGESEFNDDPEGGENGSDDGESDSDDGDSSSEDDSSNDNNEDGSVNNDGDNNPPSCDLVATPSIGLAPLSVSLDASASSDPEGNIIGYEFEFGDNSALFSSIAIVNHIYSEPGSYTAAVTVFDSQNATERCQVVINVIATIDYSGPVLPLDLSSQTPQAGDVVNITVDSGLGVANQPVELYIGSKPGPDGSLTDPAVLDSSVTGAGGIYSHSLTVPAGFVGTTWYFQAYLTDTSSNTVLETNKRALTITPHNDDADWIVTTTNYRRVSNGQITSASRPIESALKAAAPGDLILVEPGNHPKFNIANTRTPNQDMIWVKARVPGSSTKILRHTVGGSPTIGIKNGSGYVAVVGFDIETSDLAGILCDQNEPSFPSIWFLDCTMDGGYNHYTKSGNSTKWGVLGWELSDFVWRGGYIKNIHDEHAFYLHNSQGDITIEDIDVTHVGRTFIQITARDSESTTQPGAGQVTIRNASGRDCNLGDGYSGGSTISFNGRHRGTFLIDNMVTQAGFDTALNNVAGKVVGTGGFVSHHGGGSADVNNGPILMINSRLEMAPAAGDRCHIQVAATDSFSMYNTIITAGARDAICITTDTTDFLALDPDAEVSGECSAGEVNYPNYQAMINGLNLTEME